MQWCYSVRCSKILPVLITLIHCDVVFLNCLRFFAMHYMCATGGRTVEGCCVKSGVPFECLVMCRSVDDATLMYHSCVKYLHKIISCFSLGDGK